MNVASRPFSATIVYDAEMHRPTHPTGRSSPRMRVMHVSEAFCGGVQVAINYWARETGGLEHIVAEVERLDAQTGDVAGNVTQMYLAGGHLKRMWQLSVLVHLARPDVIHAHSSLAGVYVRLNPLIHGTPIVYSPHCFAFERTDIGKVRRAAFWAAECIMSLRTSSFVTVSEREARLCCRFLFRRPARSLPVLGAGAVRPIPRQRRSGHRIVAVGRIAPQKDPGFMAAAARKVLEAVPDVEFVWVGDGDPDLKECLTSAGMHVLGWRTREETLAILDQADVFVHSAAWEGSPVVIEEALAASKPIVARRLPVLADRGLTLLADDSDELAELLIEQVVDEDSHRRAAARSAALARETRIDCARSLVSTYDSVRRQA